MLLKIENAGRTVSRECEDLSAFDAEKFFKTHGFKADADHTETEAHNKSEGANSVKTKDFDPGNAAGFAIALGCFDGVHAGHRALIAETVNGGLTPAVWTFSAPLARPYINEVPERLAFCGALGIRYAFCEDFESVREMPHGEFERRLFTMLGAKKVVCGEDFRYGYRREGDVHTLAEAAKRFGAEAVVVPGVTKRLGDTEVKVSSTLIRSLIADGNVRAAGELLCRPFSISGCVSSGKKLGRTMGYPTVNLAFAPGKAVPRYGVYASICRIDGREYRSITNVGVCPTVGAKPDTEPPKNPEIFKNSEPHTNPETPINLTTPDRPNGVATCETYIIGETLDLYGKEIEVLLLDFIRPEKKFPSLDALREQITKDVERRTLRSEDTEDVSSAEPDLK